MLFVRKGAGLANAIAEHINRLLPGRAEKTVKRTNLAVLNKTNPVWVLVECGFISNVNDSSVMRNRPDKIAEHIGSSSKSVDAPKEANTTKIT